MGYERYSRGSNSAGDYGQQDHSRDYTYSSARDYRAAGYLGGDRDRDRFRGQDRDDNRDPYGERDYRGAVRRDVYRRADGPSYERHDDRGQEYRQGYDQDRGREYGRQPQGYDYEERGFLSRAGDEVRSWFGDEDAERRRDFDARHDERHYGARSGADRDSDYHSWRSGQIAALDRDYDEYRRENRSKFENEFSSWRTARQGQRDQLSKVEEHMEVAGSDGSHVGTVDKVRGDRIVLTKNDADAGGRHHSIPSSWITSVDSKVTLLKTADEAKKHWKDEERNRAFFGDRDENQNDTRDARGHTLNRSFSGTY